MAETEVAEEVLAVASPRSLGPASLFADLPVTPTTATEFCSAEEDVRATVRELAGLGFTIHEVSEATVSFSGPKKRFQEVFSARLRKEQTEIVSGAKAEFYAVSGAEKPEQELLQAPGDLAQLIEGVALSLPPEFVAASPLPPIADIHASAYRYLFVPDEVAVILRATRVHRTGGTGSGVKVAMPDTGFVKQPFFSSRGYRTNATILAAGAVDASKDTVGHGTGEAANVFAAAPDARLVPIKMGDAVDAIKKAVAQGAKIITNSWAYDIDKGSITWATLHPYFKALAQEIQLAINSGITVIFAAGNGHFAFPASMPEVIAVGGVHVNYPGLTFQASSYASSFVSKIYPGRTVPDFCGLTGKKVSIDGAQRAPSIMLPVPEDSDLDKITPTTGGTTDGWGIFSGTSAATPQVAGVAALMLERDPALPPAMVKENLANTARDVAAGATAMGDTAGTGPDLATGVGLVDAMWAYLVSVGSAASQFFEAPRERQAEMVAAGDVPKISGDFFADLIEGFRSA